MTAPRARLLRRGAAALVAGTGSLLLAASPAAATPMLESADAIELANGLAEATEEQDICYGWRVTIDNEGLYEEDRGSSLGPDVLPSPSRGCERWVIFTASLTYTPSTSESEDYVSGYDVESNFPNAPTNTDLERSGFDSGALLGDNDDLALFNAVASLPTLVAEKGLAPPVPLEANSDPLPGADRATGSPGSDRLREYWPMYLFAATMLGGGVLWGLYALELRRVEERRRRHGRPRLRPRDNQPSEMPPPPPATMSAVAPHRAPD